VAHKVAPALAVGCPIIIKPPTNTPISALIMGRIATNAGALPGSISVLPMKRQDVSLLLDSEDIEMISFTGSPDVGWKLRERAPGKRFTLELGGNSGTLVDASADIA